MLAGNVMLANILAKFQENRLEVTDPRMAEKRLSSLTWHIALSTL